MRRYTVARKSRDQRNGLVYGGRWGPFFSRKITTFLMTVLVLGVARPQI